MPGLKNASLLWPNCLDHVLLGDVALHVTVWVFVLEELREGGVLGVPVQNHHALVVTSELGQRHAVRLPRGDLDTQTDRKMTQQQQREPCVPLSGLAGHTFSPGL